ncbi:hypothetical protein HK098_006815 [Nowakowskiella sp. JEL0407]|nr:hypothetical protein HK098_006815 [Nowakowskiella sp. JEL0407]
MKAAFLIALLLAVLVIVNASPLQRRQSATAVAGDPLPTDVVDPTDVLDGEATETETAGDEEPTDDEEECEEETETPSENPTDVPTDLAPSAVEGEPGYDGTEGGFLGEESKNEGLSTGAVIGIVTAGCAALAVAGVVIAKMRAAQVAAKASTA